MDSKPQEGTFEGCFDSAKVGTPYFARGVWGEDLE